MQVARFNALASLPADLYRHSTRLNAKKIVSAAHGHIKTCFSVALVEVHPERSRGHE